MSEEATTVEHVIDMAHPSAIALQAGRTVLIASAIPMALFYATLSTAGFSAAIIVTLCWYYATVLVRIASRRRVIGATLLGAALMTVRSVVAFWTGSAFLYFLQPVAGTVVTAATFVVTAVAGRPLLERLLHDFVPVPPALGRRLRGCRFFHWASAIWAVMYLVNAAVTLWLLRDASLGVFVLFKTVLSPVLTFSTAAVTYLLFRGLLRRERVRLRWRSRSTSADAQVLAFDPPGSTGVEAIAS